MAFVRRRKTRGGGLSTALVEAYRGADGGAPRQRVLANLYGCEKPLLALAKLVVHQERLREERAELVPDLRDADEFYKTTTTTASQGRKFSAKERQEIDFMLQQRKRMKKRLPTVTNLLARIQKDSAVIEKHVKVSSWKIQKEIQRYKVALEKADNMAMLRTMEAMRKRPSDPHFDLGRDKEADKNSAREMLNMFDNFEESSESVASF